MQAIILAAGMGKRLKELTQDNTKCMVKVNGQTLIWRVLLVALLLFSVMFILLFSRAFTYDSLFCFFKDLQTGYRM